MTITDSAHDTTALILNPAMSVIRCTDNEIVAHVGSRSRRSHRIHDEQNRGHLAAYVDAFTQGATPGEVGASLGIDDETVAEFTHHLTTGKVLIPESEARFAFVATGMSLDQPHTDVSVSVVGEGRIAAAVARQLASLLDRDVAAGMDLEAAFDDDIVVVCADTVQPGLFYDADEYSRSLDTPWHLTCMDGAELLVGPTFIPEDTPNYYDFDSMDEAARVLRMNYQYEKFATPSTRPRPAPPEFVADMAASFTTTALSQHWWGQGSFVEGHVLRVDLERMQLIRDRVLRLPRNPVDMGVRSDLRHPFL